MNTIANKKKIRGAKKFNKILLRWKQSILISSKEYLLSNERWYEKQSIDPFYRLERRQPPNWIQCIQFRNLIEIGQNWINIYNDNNIDGRVFLWIYPNNFIQSQIVAVRDGMKNFYDNTFEYSQTQHRLDQNLERIALEYHLKFFTGFDCAYLTKDEYDSNKKKYSDKLIRYDEIGDEVICVIKNQKVLISELNPQ